LVGALKTTRTALSGTLGTWLFVGAVVLFGVITLGPKALANPSYFFQILVYGVANGAIYALIALGYTMVYGIIELINFAHGDVFTLAAFISFPLLTAFGLTEAASPGIGLYLALLLVAILVMAITGGVNVAIERIAYRPLRNSPRLAPLITAVGMSFFLEGAMYIWRGSNNLHYPDLLPSGRIAVGAASIGVKDLIVIGVAVALVIVLTIFINSSKLGKAMRATAQDRDAAQLMGIDINRTISATFFIGAVLAAAGGIIFGLYFNSVRFDLGFQAGLFAFTAAVFGGIGNIQGAALGGLVIGLVRAFNDGGFLIGKAAWTDVLIFAILILVLVFRPTGLLGMRVPEK
jgi:branched-chain amino acid transport system permease protein